MVADPKSQIHGRLDTSNLGWSLMPSTHLGQTAKGLFGLFQDTKLGHPSQPVPSEPREHQ